VSDGQALKVSAGDVNGLVLVLTGASYVSVMLFKPGLI